MAQGYFKTGIQAHIEVHIDEIVLRWHMDSLRLVRVFVGSYRDSHMQSS